MNNLRKTAVSLPPRTTHELRMMDCNIYTDPEQPGLYWVGYDRFITEGPFNWYDMIDFINHFNDEEVLY